MKIKSKGCIKRRIKVNGKGKLFCGFANKRHRMTRKNSSMLRQKVGSRQLSDAEYKSIKRGMSCA